jgi:hypothetical protein
MSDGVTYFGWQDTSKRPNTDKLAEASEEYEYKRGHAPSVVIMNPADAKEVETELDVRTADYIGKGVYYLGDG